MAQAPKIPLQQGANLGSLDLKTEENFQVAMMQEEEIEELEAALYLTQGEAEEEVVAASTTLRTQPTT